MDVSTRSTPVRMRLAAPAFAIATALVLAACGGAENDVVAITDTAQDVVAAVAPAAAEVSEPTAAPAEATAAPEPTEATPAEAEPAEVEAATPAPAPTEQPSAPVVQRLSADEAIANAEVNIDNLAPAQNDDHVLDIEVLAVGDGSIQTLRDVVVGDRPVLLWFFSPH